MLEKSHDHIQLTAPEMGKLWATYSREYHA